MDSLCDTVVSGVCFKEGEIPKKVRFRDKDENESMDLAADQIEKTKNSWKDKLIGSSSRSAGFVLESNEDFELLAGDVQKSFINVGLVGKVAKLDLNPDNRTKGRFTRLVVYINQDMSLVSHILINGKLQKVEYEFLPTVCCHCGRYGYLKEVCPSRVSEPSSVKQPPPSSTLTEVEKIIVNGSEETGETYEPWMLVESKSRRKTRDLSKIEAKITAKNNEASRYRALIETYHNSGSKSGAKD
ncbi:hypothetical protein Goari_016371 [Gossypium aridum]|uniref:Zinc knuckle CX2CX4HX4C domain-containing protein n=1 Tax=Gossypium aridum TaxID=34290 RepID=A0A7J8WJF1_GOSAI|nr:hypothetical protein [Gossypium aridum]